MGINKRDFLKITGLAAAAAATAGKAGAAEHGAESSGHEMAAPSGKRWAMVVDMTKCTGDCPDCIQACNKAHNVPDLTHADLQRIRNQEIKWIWTAPYENVFMVPHDEQYLVSEKVLHKPFITLCNHCENPPCVRVCPTQATFQRPDGIVQMDFHRCIGCRFCMAGCPYGSRSFNFRDPTPYISEKNFNPDFPTRTKGVVEKCNFCAERLAVGEKPACVEACKNGVLTFGNLNDPEEEVHKIVKERFTIKRKPELGTMPMVYYIV